MSRSVKAKAANLREKKIRNCPTLSPQQARDVMAAQRIREWRKDNPALPLYALLDSRVRFGELFLAVLSRMFDRAEP